MSDHFLRDENGRCHTIVTMANIYKFQGFVFENHYWCGPMKLKKDWEPAAKMGRKFFRAYGAWSKLTDDEKRATQISG